MSLDDQHHRRRRSSAPAPPTASCSTRCAASPTDLRPGDPPPAQADLGQLDRNLDDLLGVRALNGARQNRLEAALARMAPGRGATLGQLSDTEDADIAETLIDLNSQQAAYQAALKVGASILQTSLMDFPR